MKWCRVSAAVVAMTFSSQSYCAFAADRKDKKKKESSSQESRKKSDSKNVNELFRDARKLFDDEKYNEATISFNRIVKKYPTHQPSLLLYARSLYKLEKLNEAYYLFSRVNPALLDPDGAYEYGQVFYAKQQFGPALSAFQRVPANHSFADLARYYGGICAVKLKQYEVAEDLMSKALVLPEREAKSRSLYLKHITKLRELKQKQALSAERIQERARLKAELEATEKGGPAAPASTAPGAAALEPAKPEAPAEYSHKGFQSVTKKAELGLKFATQNVQKNENSEGLAKLRQTYLSVLGGAMLPVGMPSASERPVVGLQLKAKGYEDKRDGTVFVQTRDSDNSPVVQIQRTPQGSNTSVAEVDISLFAEVPVQNGYWSSLSGNYFVYAPSFVRKNRTGSRAGIIAVGQMKERYSVLGTGSVTESFDTQTKVEQTAYHADLTASYTISDELNAEVVGAYENYAYAVDTIDGPDSLFGATLTLTQSLPLSFSAKLKGNYEYLQNYIAHSMPTFGEITAEGQRFVGQFTLSAAPISWFKASLYLKQQKTIWYVDDPEKQKVFNINVQDYLSEYGASMSLNLFF